MRIGPYEFEEFMEIATTFHGNPAPGLIIGGYMVEMAKTHLPEGILFEAIVETPKCLPDAVQLLTPCSTGNGWMKILNLGRYALSLYDKYTGDGVRIFLDPAKLEMWPEIKAWLLKLKPKKEQDKERLFDEIRRSGPSICTVQPIKIQERFFKKKSMGCIVVCPICKEAYPAADGGICRGCQGEAPDLFITRSQVWDEGPQLNAVPVEQVMGKHALHDMTQIEPSKSKGPAYKSGQVLTAGDVCRLQQMGRNLVYIEEDNDPDSNWVHENKAVLSFAQSMSGEGVSFNAPPEEGKINFHAERDGLFVLDRKILERFNLVPDVMCASRQNYLVAKKGRPLAGCRAIPLYLSQENFAKAMTVLQAGPLFKVIPMRAAKAGVLVTGTEVFKGLIEDKFIPVIKSKLDDLGCRIVGADIVPDDQEVIAASVAKLIDAGADLVITTAGLSVDPEDVTRLGLLQAGLTDMLFGIPVLPGAMTLLGKINGVQVLGVPACALYFKTTSLDLLLPRLLAGLDINRPDLASMAEGSFCLNCNVCTFPKCPFGK